MSFDVDAVIYYKVTDSCKAIVEVEEYEAATSRYSDRMIMMKKGKIVAAGEPSYVLAPEIIALLIFSAVLVPLGLLSFRYAVKRAKLDGSLIQY